MKRKPYLAERGRVFWFRIRISRELTAIIGREAVSRSLSTTDFAVARHRLAHVLVWWYEMIDLISNDTSLTRDQINGLVRDFTRTEFEKFDALKRAVALAPELNAVLRQEVVHQSATRRRLIRSITDDNYFPVQASIDEFLEARGVRLDRFAAAYSEVTRAVAVGHLETIDAMALGVSPSKPLLIEMTPPVATGPVKVEQLPRSKNSKSIADLIEPYMRERHRGGISHSYANDIRTAMKWFSLWFGSSRPVAGLTPEEIRDFKDGLLLLPANWSKKLKGHTIRDAAKLNEDGHLPKLEVQALNSKRWMPVADFLAWAQRELHIPANPAVGMKIHVSKSHKRARQRDQFEIEELIKIFDAPVFRGARSDGAWYAPGVYKIRDHRFWLPLLGLFTGGRRGELCPLLLDDVVERDGVVCLRIHEHYDEKGEKLSSLKNVESERVVPLHPELLKIGFKSFVEERRAAGKARLFDCPEFNKFDQFGKWFSRLLTYAGVKTSRNTYHSFRHTMEQAMRDNIDDFTVRCRIAGRTVDHSSEGYGKGHTVKALHLQIAKIEYLGLDLSGLYEQEGPASA
jgi:integrase